MNVEVIPVKRELLSVRVDHRLTIEQMVEAGNYGDASPYINGINFPVSGKGVEIVDVVPFHFNRIITSREVITEMKKDDSCLPKDFVVSIGEFLSVGRFFPDLQEEFSVICLGTSRAHRGVIGIPYLSRCKRHGRILGYKYAEDIFSPSCIFLGVAKRRKVL